MDELMCPENCGGFMTEIHTNTLGDGSGGSVVGRCQDCFCYFELNFHHEDFKREGA